jgi:hypothetical protein
VIWAPTCINYAHSTYEFLLIAGGLSIDAASQVLWHTCLVLLYAPASVNVDLVLLNRVAAAVYTRDGVPLELDTTGFIFESD